MPDTAIIEFTNPTLTDLTAVTVQTDSRPIVLATKLEEDAELNRIADEREGGKRIKISLDEL
ncbi:hypothetical protein BTW28_07060 [Citrobacter freundii]|jgi:hypothetical protein|uniref:hypothetical protein n=1 Tax=Citrobacter TaxID=544 RepID=UPI0009475CDA|nr:MULTISPECIES: hypothetical protein [Citrobacter]APR30761.1 hypothetical protein BTW28_07060 [Citrobacter freundii]MBJ8871606.1 hypothetical protein [Citrobacter braakii]MBJ8902627.1 hypothetical protein [Citrobacter braakii]MBJ8908024.1 hypothetical protein [Citrobacter braakii]MBJ8921098.1 hypothetical protein [Citrobacter braakii]